MNDTGNPVTARPATPDDATEIALTGSLLHQVSQLDLLPVERTAADVAKSIHNGQDVWLIAEKDGMAIGHLYAERDGTELTVRAIRGTGLMDDAAIPLIRTLNNEHAHNTTDIFFQTDPNTTRWLHERGIINIDR